MFDRLSGTGSSKKTRIVKDWIREFALVPDEFSILVTELKCTEPGCPPLETVVALLGPNAVSCQQKVHLAIEEITEEQAKVLAEKLQRQMLSDTFGGTEVDECDEH